MINFIIHSSMSNIKYKKQKSFTDPKYKSPEKPFKCLGYGDCNMAFTRAEHLARHIRKHTGEKPFQCTFCHKFFSRIDNLKQHKESVHSEFHTKSKKIEIKQEQQYPLSLPSIPSQNFNTCLNVTPSSLPSNSTRIPSINNFSNVHHSPLSIFQNHNRSIRFTNGLTMHYYLPPIRIPEVIPNLSISYPVFPVPLPLCFRFASNSSDPLVEKASDDRNQRDKHNKFNRISIYSMLS